MNVGIIGGTGEAGRAVARRLAGAGHDVVIGSRDVQRANDAVTQATAGTTLALRGATNEVAAASEVIVLATPWDGAVTAAVSCREQLSGKVLISMVNALGRFGGEFQALYAARGSVAASLQASLPDTKVTTAFQHVPVGRFAALDGSLEADVLVCGDDGGAVDTTIELVDSIAGLRGVRAGSLASAAAVEALTAVLLNVNVRYRSHVAIKVMGIGGEA